MAKNAQIRRYTVNLLLSVFLHRVTQTAHYVMGQSCVRAADLVILSLAANNNECGLPVGVVSTTRAPATLLQIF